MVRSRRDAACTPAVAPRPWRPARRRLLPCLLGGGRRVAGRPLRSGHRRQCTRNGARRSGRVRAGGVVSLQRPRRRPRPPRTARHHGHGQPHLVPGVGRRDRARLQRAPAQRRARDGRQRPQGGARTPRRTRGVRRGQGGRTGTGGSGPPVGPSEATVAGHSGHARGRASCRLRGCRVPPRARPQGVPWRSPRCRRPRLPHAGRARPRRLHRRGGHRRCPLGAHRRPRRASPAGRATARPPCAPGAGRRRRTPRRGELGCVHAGHRGCRPHHRLGVRRRLASPKRRRPRTGRIPASTVRSSSPQRW